MNKFNLLRTLAKKYNLLDIYTIIGWAAKILNKESFDIKRDYGATVEQMNMFFNCSRFTSAGLKSKPGINGIKDNLEKAIEFMEKNQ